MPIEPTIAELIRTAIASDRLDLHTALPAKVVSYDSATQTATVKPSVRVTVPAGRDGYEYDDVPEIQDVPIAWMRGGGSSMQFPLQAGDHVFLVFSEADMAQWRDTGQESDPSDVTRHDWSYPVAFPVVAPRAEALRQVTSPHIECDQLTVGGDPSGMQFVALANLVLSELNKIRTAFNAHTHTVNVVVANATPISPGLVTGSGSASAPASMAAISSVASNTLKTE